MAVCASPLMEWCAVRSEGRRGFVLADALMAAAILSLSAAAAALALGNARTGQARIESIDIAVEAKWAALARGESGATPG